MFTTITLLLLNFLSGPVCCDDVADPQSCTPFDYLEEVQGCPDSWDAYLGWCEAAAQECYWLQEARPEWRCCLPGLTSACSRPLGEARHLGELIAVACEADREPAYCDQWVISDSTWSC